MENGIGMAKGTVVVAKIQQFELLRVGCPWMPTILRDSKICLQKWRRLLKEWSRRGFSKDLPESCF